MRILANAEELAPVSGIASQTLEISEELVRRGHQLELVYVKGGAYRDRYVNCCDSMHRVRALDLDIRHALRDAPKLVSTVRCGVATRPDAIYVNRFRPLPWGVATRAFTRAPVVCHLHGDVGIGHLSVNRVLGRFTSRFLCVSRFVRERFVDLGGDPARTEVVHNGVDQVEYPPGGVSERRAARGELGIDEGVPIVMYFGRVGRAKGVDVLVRALAGLVGGPRPVELLVLGLAVDPAYERRLLRSVPGLRIHRMAERTDVVTPLHAADLVVVPSVWDEPFGRTVIEGLSTGRPVIASAVGGIPEILGGEFSRFLVPPGDVPALSAKIRELLDWREQEHDLADARSRHVARSFSKVAMVDAVEGALTLSAG